ncbi:MAG: 1,4-beta-xylanase, partial [Sphingobacteriales bacterium]
MFSPKFGGIDGDIVFKNGTYHFFFKGNTKVDGKEVKNGIQQATSKSLKGPWIEDFKYLDVYSDKNIAVEGSSVFKLNNSDDYVLMYDLYTKGKYEYQTSTDLFNFTKVSKSFTKNFNPRHGSVIGITKSEARRLNDEWEGVSVDLLQPTELTDRYVFKGTGNPIIKHHFTADPAALVDNDKLWLFTGHDFEGDQKGYKMKDWLVFSSTDMKTWTEYPVPLKLSDFSWAKGGDAYAAQVIKKNNKYYFYVSTNAYGIGVAVSDKPEGPYKDALGKPLLTNKDCFDSKNYWACIDPSVYIDGDGQAWIFWGNSECYFAKLKENMTEIDGEVKRINFEGYDFTEAPWLHKKDNLYYLSYATGFPEKTAYATSKNISGPWKYQGIMNEIAGNSDTNHQSIVEFKNQWYFIYHNGSIQPNGSGHSRSVCIDKLFHNQDGTIKRISMTSEGLMH